MTYEELNALKRKLYELEAQRFELYGVEKSNNKNFLPELTKEEKKLRKKEIKNSPNYKKAGKFSRLSFLFFIISFASIFASMILFGKSSTEAHLMSPIKALITAVLSVVFSVVSFIFCAKTIKFSAKASRNFLCVFSVFCLFYIIGVVSFGGYSTFNNTQFYISSLGDGYKYSTVSENAYSIAINDDVKGKIAGEVVLPDTYKDLPITKIPVQGFMWNNEITSITLGENIEEIGESGFSACENLQTFVCNDNLKKIGNHTFNGCSKLENITFNKGLEKIGQGSFSSCNLLKEVTFTGTNEEWKLIDKGNQSYDFIIHCVDGDFPY